MIKEKINEIKNRMHRHPLFPMVKDRTILAGWILGLILVAGLTWNLTLPARSRAIQRAVNQVLEQNGDSRRLNSPLSPSDINGSRMGSYFSLNNSDTAFIFTFISDSIFFPCLAVIGDNGSVDEFISLNSQGEKILEKISPQVLALYAMRIDQTHKRKMQ